MVLEWDLNITCLCSRHTEVTQLEEVGEAGAGPEGEVEVMGLRRITCCHWLVSPGSEPAALTSKG